MPPTGNHPVRAANSSSSSPESTSGTESHTNAPNDSTRSTHVCCRTAAHTPSGIASPQVTSAAATASTSVFATPARSTVNTG